MINLGLLILGFCLGAVSGEAAVGTSSCPSVYSPFYIPETGETVCLRFDVNELRSWSDSREYCRIYGGDLAILNFGNLHHQVAEHIQDNPTWLNEGFHIGGTDELTEGTWSWLNNETMEMYSPHWFPGQPDGDEAENHACLLPFGHFYHDCHNDEKLFTICMLY